MRRPGVDEDLRSPQVDYQPLDVTPAVQGVSVQVHLALGRREEGVHPVEHLGQGGVQDPLREGPPGDLGQGPGGWGSTSHLMKLPWSRIWMSVLAPSKESSTSSIPDSPRFTRSRLDVPLNVPEGT